MQTFITLIILHRQVIRSQFFPNSCSKKVVPNSCSKNILVCVHIHHTFERLPCTIPKLFKDFGNIIQNYSKIFGLGYIFYYLCTQNLNTFDV